jgi:hypothetical protein
VPFRARLSIRPLRPRAPVVLAALVAASGLACARHVPPERPAAALYRDLERVVTLTEATGWHIDRIEIDKLQSDALESACRVPAEDRARLLAWLDREIARAGGPVELAYRARGGDLDEVDRLLTLTRIRMVLARAVATAADDCPFWIRPSTEFAGRQISDDRWQLHASGGGKLMVARTGGDSDLRFGGAGRLLLGRGFGSRSAIYSGLELGGRGSFPRDDEGARTGLVLGLDVVAPVVYRHTLVNSYVEMEAGWLGTVTEGEDGLDQGIHIGAAFGARAGRARWVFPGGALGISLERTFPSDGPAVYLFKIGFRAALDLDLN